MNTPAPAASGGLWNWFLSDGDKVLNSIGVILGALTAAGTIPAGGWIGAAVSGVLSVLHAILLPEAPAK